jgi:hypothetical protein
MDGTLAFSLASAAPTVILVDWQPADRRVANWRAAA